MTNHFPKTETVIRFTRPGKNDYIFEPFGLHSFTQNEEHRQPGDIVLEIDGQKIVVPEKLVKLHLTWLKQPKHIQDCTKYFFDYVFLDDEDKIEIDRVLKIVSQEILRRKITKSRQI